MTRAYLKKIICILLTIISMLSLFTNAAAVAVNEWTSVRNGFDNVGKTDLSGNMLQAPVVAWSQLIRGAAPIMAEVDFNNDGYKDLMYVENGIVKVIDRNKNNIFISNVTGVSGVVGAFDLNADGNLEVLARQGNSVLVSISKTTGNALWSRNFNTGNGANFYCSNDRILVTNIQGDSKLEIILYLYNDDYIHCVNGDTGNDVYSFTTVDDTGYNLAICPPQLTIMDYDGNGSLEIGLSHYGTAEVRNGQTGAQIKTYNAWKVGPDNNGRQYGTTRYVNVNGDSYKDACVISNIVNRHAGVASMSATPSRLWDTFFGYMPQEAQSMATDINAIQDIDSDGQVEMVYSVWDINYTPSPTWKTYIVRASDGYVKQTFTDRYLIGIDDLNNDGKKELILINSTTQSPNLRAEKNLCRYNGSTYIEEYTIAAGSSMCMTNIQQSDRPLDVNRTGYDVVMTADMNGDGAKEYFVYDYAAKTTKAYSYSGTLVWSSNAGLGYKLVSLFNDSTKQVVTVDEDGNIKLVKGDQTVAWSMLVPGSPSMTPAVSDIDNDGNLEMVISDEAYTRAYSIGSSGLTLKWKSSGFGSRAAALTYQNGYSPVIADMTGDTGKEIVVGDYDSSGVPLIKVLKSDGTTAWTTTFSGFGTNTLYQWMAGNYNSDTQKDIYAAIARDIGQQTAVSRIIDGSTHNVTWSKDDTSDQTPQYNQRPFGPWTGYAASADYDGCGKDEIFLDTTDHLERLKWNGSGYSITWLEDVYVDQSQNTMYNTPVITNIDGIGNKESLWVAGYQNFNAFNDALTTRLWNISSAAFDMNTRMPGVADIDNDGIQEVVIQRGDNGNLISYNANNGSQEWSYTLPAGTIATNIATGDMDGDGLKELIFGTTNGYIYCVNGEASPSSRVQWSVNIGSPLGNVVLADINGDLKSDILVSSTNGYVYALIGSGSIHTTQIPPNYANNAQYEIGTKFKTMVDGQITKVKVYTSTNEGGDHTVRIWRVSDATCIAGPYTWNITSGTSGWKEYTLPSPLNIVADTDYIVDVTNSATDKYYSFGENVFPISNGYLVTYSDSGLANATLGQMPNNCSSNYRSYFRDIVFIPNWGSGVNLAAGKTVTGSSTVYSPSYVTDGDKNTANYASQASGPQWVKLDLGAGYNIKKVRLWHYYGDGRTTHDVIVQLSNTSDFSSYVTTVFNNDTNNSAGQGTGSDAEYVETASGKTIMFSPVNARYIRLWSNGSNVWVDNYYVEVEVWGNY